MNCLMISLFAVGFVGVTQVAAAAATAAAHTAAATAVGADWDGSFAAYVGNNNFCTDCVQYGPANKCGYICAGGGGGGPSTCAADVCSSGQYSFTSERGWQINTTAQQAKGHIPYRAFAYVPFCYGNPMSQCWDSNTAHNFSFSLMTTDMAGWGIYVKLLFWTDSGNILGLLPPGAPGAKQHQPPVTKYSIISFPTTDYPNGFTKSMEIDDGVWYNVVVMITGSSVTLSVNGTPLGTANVGGVGTGANGPQFGMYGFDYGGTMTSTATSMFLKHVTLDGKLINL